MQAHWVGLAWEQIPSGITVVLTARRGRKVLSNRRGAQVSHGKFLGQCGGGLWAFPSCDQPLPFAVCAHKFCSRSQVPVPACVPGMQVLARGQGSLCQRYEPKHRSFLYGLAAGWMSQPWTHPGTPLVPDFGSDPTCWQQRQAPAGHSATGGLGAGLWAGRKHLLSWQWEPALSLKAFWCPATTWHKRQSCSFSECCTLHPLTKAFHAHKMQKDSKSRLCLLSL